MSQEDIHFDVGTLTTDAEDMLNSIAMIEGASTIEDLRRERDEARVQLAEATQDSKELAARVSQLLEQHGDPSETDQLALRVQELRQEADSLRAVISTHESNTIIMQNEHVEDMKAQEEKFKEIAAEKNTLEERVKQLQQKLPTQKLPTTRRGSVSAAINKANERTIAELREKNNLYQGGNRILKKKLTNLKETFEKAQKTRAAAENIITEKEKELSELRSLNETTTIKLTETEKQLESQLVSVDRLQSELKDANQELQTLQAQLDSGKNSSANFQQQFHECQASVRELELALAESESKLITLQAQHDAEKASLQLHISNLEQDSQSEQASELSKEVTALELANQQLQKQKDDAEAIVGHVAAESALKQQEIQILLDDTCAALQEVRDSHENCAAEIAQYQDQKNKLFVQFSAAQRELERRSGEKSRSQELERAQARQLAELRKQLAETRAAQEVLVAGHDAEIGDLKEHIRFIQSKVDVSPDRLGSAPLQGFQLSQEADTPAGRQAMDQLVNFLLQTEEDGLLDAASELLDTLITADAVIIEEAILQLVTVSNESPSNTRVHQAFSLLFRCFPLRESSTEDSLGFKTLVLDRVVNHFARLSEFYQTTIENTSVRGAITEVPRKSEILEFISIKDATTRSVQSRLAPSSAESLSFAKEKSALERELRRSRTNQVQLVSTHAALLSEMALKLEAAQTRLEEKEKLEQDQAQMIHQLRLELFDTKRGEASPQDRRLISFDVDQFTEVARDEALLLSAQTTFQLGTGKKPSTNAPTVDLTLQHADTKKSFLLRVPITEGVGEVRAIAHRILGGSHTLDSVKLSLDNVELLDHNSVDEYTTENAVVTFQVMVGFVCWVVAKDKYFNLRLPFHTSIHELRGMIRNKLGLPTTYPLSSIKLQIPESNLESSFTLSSYAQQPRLLMITFDDDSSAPATAAATQKLLRVKVRFSGLNLSVWQENKARYDSAFLEGVSRVVGEPTSGLYSLTVEDVVDRPSQGETDSKEETDGLSSLSISVARFFGAEEKGTASASDYVHVSVLVRYTRSVGSIRSAIENAGENMFADLVLAAYPCKSVSLSNALSDASLNKHQVEQLKSKQKALEAGSKALASRVVLADATVEDLTRQLAGACTKCPVLLAGNKNLAKRLKSLQTSNAIQRTTAQAGVSSRDSSKISVLLAGPMTWQSAGEIVLCLLRSPSIVDETLASVKSYSQTRNQDQAFGYLQLFALLLRYFKPTTLSNEIGQYLDFAIRRQEAACHSFGSAALMNLLLQARRFFINTQERGSIVNMPSNAQLRSDFECYLQQSSDPSATDASTMPALDYSPFLFDEEGDTVDTKYVPQLPATRGNSTLYKGGEVIHRHIFAFMGHISESTSRHHAQEIIRQVLALPALMEEAFIQVVVQLTNASLDNEAYIRAWLLMALLVQCFHPPSSEFCVHLREMILLAQSDTHAKLVSEPELKWLLPVATYILEIFPYESGSITQLPTAGQIMSLLCVSSLASSHPDMPEMFVAVRKEIYSHVFSPQLESTTNHTAQANAMFEHILAFTGKINPSQMPLLHLVELMRILVQSPECIDEFYMQMKSQMTSGNSDKTSEIKSWQLLILISEQFAPSKTVVACLTEALLENHMDVKASDHHAEQHASHRDHLKEIFSSKFPCAVSLTTAPSPSEVEKTAIHLNHLEQFRPVIGHDRKYQFLPKEISIGGDVEVLRSGQQLFEHILGFTDLAPAGSWAQTQLRAIIDILLAHSVLIPEAFQQILAHLDGANDKSCLRSWMLVVTLAQMFAPVNEEACQGVRELVVQRQETFDPNASDAELIGDMMDYFLTIFPISSNVTSQPSQEALEMCLNLDDMNKNKESKIYSPRTPHGERIRSEGEELFEHILCFTDKFAPSVRPREHLHEILAILVSHPELVEEAYTQLILQMVNGTSSTRNHVRQWLLLAVFVQCLSTAPIFRGKLFQIIKTMQADNNEHRSHPVIGVECEGLAPIIQFVVDTVQQNRVSITHIPTAGDCMEFLTRAAGEVHPDATELVAAHAVIFEEMFTPKSPVTQADAKLHSEGVDLHAHILAMNGRIARDKPRGHVTAMFEILVRVPDLLPEAYIQVLSQCTDSSVHVVVHARSWLLLVLMATYFAPSSDAFVQQVRHIVESVKEDNAAHMSDPVEGVGCRFVAPLIQKFLDIFPRQQPSITRPLTQAAMNTAIHSVLDFAAADDAKYPEDLQVELLDLFLDTKFTPQIHHNSADDVKLSSEIFQHILAFTDKLPDKHPRHHVTELVGLLVEHPHLIPDAYTQLATEIGDTSSSILSHVRGWAMLSVMVKCFRPPEAFQEQFVKVLCFLRDANDADVKADSVDHLNLGHIIDHVIAHFPCEENIFSAPTENEVIHLFALPPESPEVNSSAVFRDLRRVVFEVVFTLHHELTDYYDEAEAKNAVEHILCFIGKHPATLSAPEHAKAVLSCMIRAPTIVDEVFLQVWQLREAKKLSQDETLRLWMMLALLTQTFAPNEDFAKRYMDQLMLAQDENQRLIHDPDFGETAELVAIVLQFVVDSFPCPRSITEVPDTKRITRYFRLDNYDIKHDQLPSHLHEVASNAIIQMNRFLNEQEDHKLVSHAMNVLSNILVASNLLSEEVFLHIEHTWHDVDPQLSQRFHVLFGLLVACFTLRDQHTTFIQGLAPNPQVDFILGQIAATKRRGPITQIPTSAEIATLLNGSEPAHWGRTEAHHVAQEFMSGELIHSKEFVPLTRAVSVEHNDVLHSEAKAAFDDMQAFACDVPSSRAALDHVTDLLQRVIDHPEITEEVYLRTLSQMRQNPDSKSELRYALLIPVLCSYFAPKPAMAQTLHDYFAAALSEPEDSDPNQKVKLQILEFAQHQLGNTIRRGSITALPATDCLMRVLRLVRWSTTHTPYTDLVMNSPKLRHEAASVFSHFLAFTTDLPATLPPWQDAQAILDIVCRNPELVDEIYLQLTHQQSGNPEAKSSLRGWLLFNLFASAFVPSAGMHQSLRMFLEHQADLYQNSNHANLEFASICKKTLNDTIARGTSIVFSLDKATILDIMRVKPVVIHEFPPFVPQLPSTSDAREAAEEAYISMIRFSTTKNNGLVHMRKIITLLVKRNFLVNELVHQTVSLCRSHLSEHGQVWHFRGLFLIGILARTFVFEPDTMDFVNMYLNAVAAAASDDDEKQETILIHPIRTSMDFTAAKGRSIQCVPTDQDLRALCNLENSGTPATIKELGADLAKRFPALPPVTFISGYMPGGIEYQVFSAVDEKLRVVCQELFFLVCLFMGDTSTEQTNEGLSEKVEARIASKILTIIGQYPSLTDELFLQLRQQLLGRNETHEAQLTSGWILFALIASYVTPSTEERLAQIAYFVRADYELHMADTKTSEHLTQQVMREILQQELHGRHSFYVVPHKKHIAARLSYLRAAHGGALDATEHLSLALVFFPLTQPVQDNADLQRQGTMAFNSMLWFMGESTLAKESLFDIMHAMIQYPPLIPELMLQIQDVVDKGSIRSAIRGMVMLDVLVSCFHQSDKKTKMTVFLEEFTEALDKIEGVADHDVKYLGTKIQDTIAHYAQSQALETCITRLPTVSELSDLLAGKGRPASIPGAGRFRRAASPRAAASDSPRAAASDSPRAAASPLKEAKELDPAPPVVVEDVSVSAEEKVQTEEEARWSTEFEFLSEVAIIEENPTLNQAAHDMFDRVCLFMQDKEIGTTRFFDEKDKPVRHILWILNLAHEHPQLIEETYLQMKKQVTAHPAASKEFRGWLLFATYSSFVSPKPRFASILSVLLRARLEKNRSECNRLGNDEVQLRHRLEINMRFISRIVENLQEPKTLDAAVTRKIVKARISEITQAVTAEIQQETE
jgi:hypothetical protein